MATGTIERPYAGNSALMALGSADAVVPENANFNNYIVPGVYSIPNGAVATTLSNRPSNYAGLLRVYKTLGQGNDAGSSWYYVTQQYEDIYGNIYKRKGSSTSNPTISWGNWTPLDNITRFTISAGKTATVTFSSSEFSFIISGNGYQANIKAGLWHLGGYATASRGVLTQIVNSASSIVVNATADATYFTIANTSANPAQISIFAMTGTITGVTIS